MSTTVIRDRSVVDARPVYRRPDWRQEHPLSGSSRAPLSNTWGSGSVRTPTRADRGRRERIAASVERPFDDFGRWTRCWRRAAMVIGSPGASLVALGVCAVLLGAAPVMAASDQDGADPETPSGTTVVSVSTDESLSDIARTHAPEAPVGDVVARIASMNDISGMGQEADATERRDMVVPVY